ncbi:hypothetical protein KI387_038749 [Taxus chinensis]|uniref:RRM domain-containing protein n=1 Tax=Taxus chinensis TaxID=29808 RepID=A0AA38C5T3_TAXCH|nr:hypothetical protein KI387_038749 [Taxus chinensis]
MDAMKNKSEEVKISQAIGGADIMRMIEEKENLRSISEDYQEEMEEIKRLYLDPLNKEQLLHFLSAIALKDTQRMQNIREVAAMNPGHRKLVIRGLARNTTAETLNFVFSLYGEVENCEVIMDRDGNRSKEYAIVTYKAAEAAWRALKDPCKIIDSTRTICSFVTQENDEEPEPREERTIHVSDVPLHMPYGNFLHFFSQYGEVEAGYLGCMRGEINGLVRFRYVRGAMHALEIPVKSIDRYHHMYCTKTSENLTFEGDQRHLGRRRNPHRNMPLLPASQYPDSPKQNMSDFFTSVHKAEQHLKKVSDLLVAGQNEKKNQSEMASSSTGEEEARSSGGQSQSKG